MRVWTLIKEAIRDIEVANNMKLGEGSWERLKKLDEDIQDELGETVPSDEHKLKQRIAELEAAVRTGVDFANTVEGLLIDGSEGLVKCEDFLRLAHAPADTGGDDLPSPE